MAKKWKKLLLTSCLIAPIPLLFSIPLILSFWNYFKAPPSFRHNRWLQDWPYVAVVYIILAVVWARGGATTPVAVKILVILLQLAMVFGIVAAASYG